MDMPQQGKKEPPPGWRVDERGAWVRETVPSMMRRLMGWDYRRPCIYQITVVLADRGSRALGRLLVGDGKGGLMPVDRARGLGLAPEAVCADVEPSPLGAAVAACWEALTRYYPQVKVIGKRVMPDHFHGILWVQRPLDCHLGQVVKGFKTGCNKAARGLGVQFSTTVSSSTGRRTGGLFAEGFQDTILFRDGQLAKMRHYLADNPRRLAVKLLFPDLFKTVSALRVPLPGLGPSACGRFAALGNRFLLRRPLVQVQVSRRQFAYRRMPVAGGGALKIARDAAGEPLVACTSPAFEERLAAYLAAARHGAVLLSPCVSDGERQVARAALASGLPRAPRRRHAGTDRGTGRRIGRQAARGRSTRCRREGRCRRWPWRGRLTREGRAGRIRA